MFRRSARQHQAVHQAPQEAVHEPLQEAAHHCAAAEGGGVVAAGGVFGAAGAGSSEAPRGPKPSCSRTSSASIFRLVFLIVRSV
jgi:hypothetical protein